MNAPIIWILFPIGLAALIWIIRDERWISVTGGAISLLLAALAARLPIDTVVSFGSLAFRIAPTFAVLGRQLTITSAHQPLLVIIYGIVAFWFLGTIATGYARRLVSLGFVITALLVSHHAPPPFCSCSCSPRQSRRHL